MKGKKKVLLIVLALLIVTRLVLTVVENNKAKEGTGTEFSSAPITESLNPDANLSKMPDEAVVAHHDEDKDNLCQSLRERYSNIKELKKIEKVSTRFLNIHKKVDGLVYRLRFFYKDANESEIPTFLLYKEDKNEEAHIIENTAYKKGPQYLEIEKAAGTILYTEEGANLGKEQDLFLHFENNELKDLQGISPHLPVKDYIECRF